MTQQERTPSIRQRLQGFLGGRPAVQVSVEAHAPAAAPSPEAPRASRRSTAGTRTPDRSHSHVPVFLAGVVAATGVRAVGLAAYEFGRNDGVIVASATSTPFHEPTAVIPSPSGDLLVTFLPTEAPTVAPTEAPSATPSETAVVTASPEWVNPIRIESAEAAALRFGVEGDPYSTNPNNWEINEWGGAHLKETEKAVKVKLDGTVAEGWIKSKMVNARDAYTFVADSSVEIVEANGLTLWDFGGNPDGFAQVWKQVNDKEAIEQPEVTVIPLCEVLEPIQTNDVPLVKISSPEEAASMFGVEGDPYSTNPNNWEINEYGGAHLIDNPNGEASLVRLNGSVAEGYIKANRENGRNAITYVVHPNVLFARFVGLTMWELTDPDRGFQQVLGQVIVKEEEEQPDVTVLSAYNCTVQ